jgi:hypothetical protein
MQLKKHKVMKNMGEIDRTIRMVIAFAIVLLFINGNISGGLGIALIVVAFVFAFTSLMSFCPLYMPFKISTVRKKATRKN